MAIVEEHVLSKACMYNELETVNHILKHSIMNLTDFAEEFRRAFIAACKCGHIDIVTRMLLDTRFANYEIDGLQWAIFMGRLRITEMLLHPAGGLFSATNFPFLVVQTVIFDSRKKWYATRAQQFNELHTELVATVTIGCHNCVHK